MRSRRHIHSQHQPTSRAPRRRIEQIVVHSLVADVHTAQGLRNTGFGNHHFGEVDRGWKTHQDRREQIANRAAGGQVRSQNSPRHKPHAADHNHRQFRPRQASQIRPDHKRGLSLA